MIVMHTVYMFIFMFIYREREREVLYIRCSGSRRQNLDEESFLEGSGLTKSAMCSGGLGQPADHHGLPQASPGSGAILTFMCVYIYIYIYIYIYAQTHFSD